MAVSFIFLLFIYIFIHPFLMFAFDGCYFEGFGWRPRMVLVTVVMVCGSTCIASRFDGSPLMVLVVWLLIWRFTFDGVLSGVQFR